MATELVNSTTEIVDPADAPASFWSNVRAATTLFRDASEYGVVYDTAVDSSAAAQAAIDANKGGFLVFSKDFLAKDLKMQDSTYNDTTVVMEGRMYLAGDGSVNTAGLPLPAGLFIGTADNVTIVFRGNGNRLNMTVREQISMLMLAGCTNINIPIFDVEECRGDGCYISHLGSGVLGDICDGVHFGRFRAVNSATDGRNGLTIITGKNIVIDDFFVNRFGKLVGGGVMPGGFDIEPNNNYELVENVQVGKAYIRTVGTAGFAVHGRGTKLTKFVQCHDLFVENYADPTIADEFSNVTQSSGSRLIRVANSDFVSIKGQGRFINTYGVGLETQGSNDCTINLSAERVHYGLYAGGAATLGGVTTCERNVYKVNVKDVSRYAHFVGNLNDCEIDGDISDPKTTYYSNRFAVIIFGTNNRCNFKSQPIYSTNWTRAYRNSAGAYTSCVMSGVNLSEFTTINNRIDDTSMMRFDCLGVTDSTVQHNDGSWIAGQFVTKSNPTKTANGNILTGWVRLTTGSANVAGTDWEPVYQPTTDVSHA